MSQVKDPKIKLFGKTIGMPETSKAAGIRESAAESCDTDAEYSVNQNHARSILQHSDFNGDREYRESQEKQPGPGQHSRPNEGNQSQPSPSNESKATNACTPPSDNSKERQIEPSNSDEKNLKKPDKILPCPRCNSMDTKFCYFNNYNVNQPRHFCKNCQRYWTDGGAMRNVPVGAGRRKNKNQAASQFHPVAVSEATCRENPNGTSFLAFGSDTRVPLCESSMVPVLNIGDNAIERKEEDNGHEHSSEPLKDEVPFVDGVPLPYPWHSVQWSPPMAPPTFGTSNYPMHFYPTAPPYWAGPGLWNAPNSPTLGKHSRDESTTANSENEQEKRMESDPDTRLWVPKTLRLDDHPGEASRSSILSTLGIDSDGADVGASGGGGLVEAFRRKSKDGVRNRPRECSSTVLQSNLAALSRSVGFHESS